jgi:hypothetical protein
LYFPIAALVLSAFVSVASAADGLVAVKRPHSAKACTVVPNLRRALPEGPAAAAVAP